MRYFAAFHSESIIALLAMDAYTTDKWISLAAFSLSIYLFIFAKFYGKHFSDHTLQKYRLISPHCLYILPLRKHR